LFFCAFQIDHFIKSALAAVA